jgi:hypothetical protein
MNREVDQVKSEDIKPVEMIIQSEGEETYRPVWIEEYPGIPVEQVGNRLIRYDIGQIIEMEGTAK